MAIDAQRTSSTDLLLRSVAPQVVKTVRALLGSAHPDLDDAVQIALFGFARALPVFRGDCEPAGYARAIALRSAKATRRRARRHNTERAMIDPDGLASAHASPSESANANERKALLSRLFAELPPEQADVFARRIALGWSSEEIARQSGTPVNTVRSRLRLARERMRARIEEDPELSALLGRPGR